MFRRWMRSARQCSAPGFLAGLESLDRGSGGAEVPHRRLPWRLEVLEARVTPAFLPTTLALFSDPEAVLPGETLTLTAYLYTDGTNGPELLPEGTEILFFDLAAQIGIGATDEYGLSSVEVTDIPSGGETYRASFAGLDTGFDSYGASEGFVTVSVSTSPPPPPPPPGGGPVLPDDPLPPETRPRLFASGSDAGVPGIASLNNPDGSPRLQFDPYGPSFTGGVRVAAGDVTGDGVPDLITGPGPGFRPEIQVFDGSSGERLSSYLAFEDSFRGGVFVTAADVDGDGKSETIVSPDRSGGPRVRVLTGVNGTQSLADFFGIEDPNFRGGARVAAGDVDGDFVPELIVGAGFGGGPRVAVFDGSSVLDSPGAPGRLIGDFFAFEPTLRNGAYVAAGDVSGDGFADLVFGGGPNGGPRILGLDGSKLIQSGGTNKTQLVNTFAFDPTLRGGVRPTIGDVNGDGWGDILAAAGDGAGTPVALIGPYLGQPEPIGAGLGGADGLFIGAEPLPVDALLPYSPDDLLYSPVYDELLFDYLYEDGLDEVLTDDIESQFPDLDLIGTILGSEDPYGVLDGGSFGVAPIPDGKGYELTPLEPGAPPPSGGAVINVPNWSPGTGGSSGPLGSVNAYPRYPAPGGSPSSPSYTPNPVPRTPPSGGVEPSAADRAKAQVVGGIWSADIQGTAQRGLGLEFKNGLGAWDIRITAATGDEFTLYLSGVMIATGPQPPPYSPVALQIDPNNSTYNSQTGRIIIQGVSDSRKRLSIQGVLRNGLISVDSDTTYITSDPWNFQVKYDYILRRR